MTIVPHLGKSLYNTHMNDPNDPRYKALKKILDEILDLKTSPLYAYRKENGYHPVIGQGNHHAKIMFIGEAPGENEAKTAKSPGINAM